MTETLTAPRRTTLTVVRRTEVKYPDSGGANANRRQKTGAVDENCLRTYLRLIRSFLGANDGSSMTKAMAAAGAPPMSERLAQIEVDLLSKARAVYVNDRKRNRRSAADILDRGFEERVSTEFDRLPLVDRARYVNRVYCERIEAMGCDAFAHNLVERSAESDQPSHLLDPDLENQAIENLQALLRMPVPGLSLNSHTLRSQLPDGRWAASPIPDNGTIVNLEPSEVFGLCERFVYRLARKMYLAANVVDGRIGVHNVPDSQASERFWRWLPLDEQQIWMSKALSALSRKTQVDRDANAADLSHAGVGADRQLTADDADFQNKARLRTYLRLIHSFLDPNEASSADEDSDTKATVQKATTAVANAKGLVGLSALITLKDSLKDGSRNPLFARLSDIEKTLVYEARRTYFHDQKLYNFGGSRSRLRKDDEIAVAIMNKFDRMSYLERADCINHVYRERIDAMGCDAMVHESSPFLASDIENLVVENILSMIRMPAPGLKLRGHTLQSRMSDGRWLVSSNGNDEATTRVDSVDVLGYCEDYVRHLAGNLFLSGGVLLNDQPQELTLQQQRHWRWLPFAEQHAWMSRALDRISRRTQVDVLNNLEHTLPVRYLSKKPK